MALQRIKIYGKPNKSIQIEDNIWYAKTNINGGKTINAPISLGKVYRINPDGLNFYIDVDFDPLDHANFMVGDFILFSKSHKVNTSKIKGYYADVSLENNSSKRAELFAVGSEVASSSK